MDGASALVTRPGKGGGVLETCSALEDFLRSRLAANLAPTTTSWYRQKIGRFANQYPELPTTPEPIEDFLASVTGTPETRNAYFRALRAFFHFTCDRYGLDNPMKKVAAPRCPRKVMVTLELREIHRLLLAATTLRDKTVLTLLVDTGIRTGELASLRPQDILTDTIVVRGKTGQREVPVSEETYRLLLALIRQNKGKDFVFYGHKGPMTRKGVYHLVRDCMKQAGIKGPKMGAHRIRHAFGKGYLVSGGDVRSLQQIMGHSNITTTEKYASLNLNDTIKKHHEFSPLHTAHMAAQESMFETVREAEEIIKRKKGGQSD